MLPQECYIYWLCNGRDKLMQADLLVGYRILSNYLAANVSKLQFMLDMSRVPLVLRADIGNKSGCYKLISATEEDCD